MTTRLTARSVRHVGSFSIASLTLLGGLLFVTGIFGGVVVFIPALLVIGPIALAAWWAFHERTLPDEISPYDDEDRGP